MHAEKVSFYLTHSVLFSLQCSASFRRGNKKNFESPAGQMNEIKTMLEISQDIK